MRKESAVCRLQVLGVCVLEGEDGGTGGLLLKKERHGLSGASAHRIFQGLWQLPGSARLGSPINIHV